MLRYKCENCPGFMKGGTISGTYGKIDYDQCRGVPPDYKGRPPAIKEPAMNVCFLHPEVLKETLGVRDLASPTKAIS